MGNCNACVRGEVVDEKTNKKNTNHHSNQKNDKNKKNKNKNKGRERRPNPYSDDQIWSPALNRVLKDVIPLSHRTRIGDKYVLGRETTDPLTPAHGHRSGGERFGHRNQARARQKGREDAR
ncbi:hypothetical protein TIFTF001_031658 [Ficus carica]|uniref:Uncharacterized protein n=1 Tax=Ficus carica TaxID=3494 RepID=A0AA88DVC7_FICCA|nr:hypothetical protein TIFTF001_031658 [Ficus carica]